MGLEFRTIKTFVPHLSVGQASQCPWAALPGRSPRRAYSQKGRERATVAPQSVPRLPTQNPDQWLDLGARSCCLGKERARGASLGSRCMSWVSADLTTCPSGWQRGPLEGSRKDCRGKSCGGTAAALPPRPAVTEQPGSWAPNFPLAPLWVYLCKGG